MNEHEVILCARILHKPYQDYCLTKKEQLRAKNCLWICYRKPSQNANKLYSYYAEIIKHLKAKNRTIIFYGVPIRLSKQQFYVLWLLLATGDIKYSDYAELSYACNGKKMKKSAVNTNLKCFMSDFYKKIFNKITEYKERHKCYFTDMSEDTIQKFVKDFLHYESYCDGYIIKINCPLVYKKRVKVNCKKL